jgi:hypothetical protein
VCSLIAWKTYRSLFEDYLKVSQGLGRDERLEFLLDFREE